MDTQLIDQFSFMEKLGVIPGILSLIAVLLGVAALAMRRKVFSDVAKWGVLAVAFFGISEIARRLHEVSRIPSRGGYLEPSGFLLEAGNQCLAGWVMMASCGFGTVLVAVSFLLAKDRVQTS